ncbi:TldD/PmbA family protein [Acidianus sulfidivorans JP7]|uniref:TldD/PmbA family protein n=1 Tax=Acidianus sulfidivorans JP7 TaxID=619593 RepID=A0A2U9IQP1_9CREN|nr:TldD/PmbA family protein [Acidianus sulfidivorans JP7]
MNEDLIQLLEKIKGFDEVALFKAKSENTVVKLVLGKVSAVQNLDDEVTYALVKKDKKYMITTISGKSDNINVNEGLIKTIDNPSLSPIISDNDKEYKLEKTNSKIEELRKNPDPAISIILDNSEFPLSGILNIRKTSVSLVTSKGFNGIDIRDSIDGYFRAFNGEYSGQWSFANTKFSETELKDTIKIANDFASIKNKVEVDEGKYDLLLSPLVFGNLMNYLASMSSGLSILMGNSIFAKYKPGDKIASEKFTFSDVPSEDRPSSISFDQEATFTRNNNIIENGIYKTPLLNNELAQIFNSKTTGNAGWIYPQPWTLEIKEGEVSKDSLTSGNVIMFNNNWYTRFQNYAEGNFSTVGRDAIVVYKNGEIMGVTTRLRIADSMINIIRNIEEMSKERYLVKWWDSPIPVLSPYVLVKDIKITRA